MLESVRPKNAYDLRRAAVKKFEETLHYTGWPKNTTWEWKVKEAFTKMMTLIEEANRNQKALYAAQEAFDKFSPDWRKTA